METAGIRAATWVVGKALSPLSGEVLEAWAASTKLGSNIEALKLALLEAQGMLNSAQGREIHNTALAELLDKLRQLAYGADDVLDELDYFRIQDELDGTYHAADAHAAGWIQDLALNARHTARVCVNKLKFSASRRDDPDNGAKQGCLSGLRSCGRHEIRTSPPSPADQLGVQEVHRGCMHKAAHNVGKHFSCFSLLSVDHDAPTDAGPSTIEPINGATEIPKLKFDRVELSRKILDIVDQFKPVCAAVSRVLNLELLNCSHIPAQDIVMNRPKTTPQIIEPKLYGRDSKKKIIIDEIVNGERCQLTVLPIVGPGGIGKTTFTQHIYEQMKSHFQVPIWICVSLDFDANRLARDITKLIPEVDNEKKNCSDEELIEQRIKGKRVLLVLDDVWTHHEDEWKKLLALFKKEGSKGNVVIVTTRIPDVANKVTTTKCSLELERLSPEDIMSFFEECVFGHQKPWADHLGLFEVGRKIVDKLKGSPLAAKTVGRLLRNKLSLNHWISILDSKEWESQTNDNDIMPALKLSYDYLPFHLQQCFFFSALFPEDYQFGGEELVHFWIGLDILHSCDQNRKRIEDVGFCYLNELVNHGFFKMNKNKFGRPYYVIHDLLHELAVKVSSNECLSICSSNMRYREIPTSVRHLSIIVDNTTVKDRMSFEDHAENLTTIDKRLKVEHLHTLMLFGEFHGCFAKTFCGLFKEATALRVIFLSEPSYALQDVLPNLPKLVHLRYLKIKLSNSLLMRLPSVLFRLYHLEVIDLQSMHYCDMSIRNMSNLVKMRHFLLPKHQYFNHVDIFGVGKLKFLQELNGFSVRKESGGFEPSEVGKLTEIRGSLLLRNLQNVQTREEANELKLIHKKHLVGLSLYWGAKCSNKDHVQEHILGSLVPHSGLQKLNITGHGGTSCPGWLCTNLCVKSLESLCLDDVSWKNFPPLGELWMINERSEEYQSCSISPPSFHNMKRLELRRISSLIRVGASSFLSNLEVLIISYCPELMELPFSDPSFWEAERDEKRGWFPKLQELNISGCRKLELLPPIPWQTCAPCSVHLKRVGSGIQELFYPSSIHQPGISLRVDANGYQGGLSWNRLKFSNLTDLKELHVKNIPPLPLDKLQLLPSLKKMEISDSSSLLPPVQSAGNNSTYRFPVEIIKIINCDTSGRELTLLLSFLPCLSELEINKCENITGLGVMEHPQQQKQTGREEEIITTATLEGLLLLPPQIRDLKIVDCKNVSLLHEDHAEEAAGEASGGGLQRLSSLRDLYVARCPEFLSSYSSSSFFPYPNCLQGLIIEGARDMETLQALSNLTSLAQLSLFHMGRSRDDGLWPLLAHGCLTGLSVYTDYNFFSCPDPSSMHDKVLFPCSSKLRELYTTHNAGFLAAPICRLFSSTLTTLSLDFDDAAECLTKEQEEALQLLNSLQELVFRGGSRWGPKLQCLPAGLHKLLNLKRLTIEYCSAIQSLPSLPSSLQELVIDCCGALKSLPNSLPSSMEILKISQCEAIKSLPKDGLPSSMRELDVRQCNIEELRRACRKLIGTIPIVRT